jgi:hypothetical protein
MSSNPVGAVVRKAKATDLCLDPDSNVVSLKGAPAPDAWSPARRSR